MNNKWNPSFGYYSQIWFNRAYTYECAVEEMPAGYGDKLLSVSPVWAFPVVVASGIIVSVLVTVGAFLLTKSINPITIHCIYAAQTTMSAWQYRRS